MAGNRLPPSMALAMLIAGTLAGPPAAAEPVLLGETPVELQLALETPASGACRPDVALVPPPWLPEENIRMSARFLRYLLEQTDSLEDALAAYYQGLGALRAHGRYAVAEPYVAAVLNARPLFAPTLLDEALAPSPDRISADRAPAARPASTS